MKYRGLDDDLSRGPVTTLEFEKKLIRTIAAYKINLYSPYFEHTADYASNPLIAPPGGGISAADAAALVAYAKPYHVTIVPEQEAFGHLHNALLWEQYQPLAETPHGAVLAPGQPGSIALIKQEFTELAAEYPGPFLHIGADETVDLGLGQTKADVDARGLGPVYLDFMQQIVTALAAAASQAALLGRHRAGLARSVEGSAAELQGRDHRGCLGLQPGAEGLRQVADAVYQRRLRDLGLAQRAQLPRGLSGQQYGAAQHSAVHARRAEAWLDRPAEHHLERRWRGPDQPGLVRHSVRRGGRVAAGRIVHRGIRAELRARSFTATQPAR